MRQRFALLLGMAAVTLALRPAPVAACQNVCVIYGTAGTRGVLMESGAQAWPPRPISNAKLVVRDASPTAIGPETKCGRKGPIVMTTSTDKHGNFRLKGIHPGKYYITYLNSNDGQSFLVEFGSPDATKKRLKLSLFNPGGACWAEDIERNVLIPDWGGIKPVKDDH
jgi:hypothetical protein